MLDGLADETMATGDENDIRHIVRVRAGGRGGRGVRERIGEKRLDLWGSLAGSTLHPLGRMKRLAPSI